MRRAGITLKTALECLGKPGHQTAFLRQVLGPLANPFALTWLPVTPQDAPTAEIRTVEQSNLPTRGSGLHPGNSTDNVDGPEGQFHHISIEPQGEVFYVRDTPTPSPEITMTAGNAATIVKARVELLMGNARPRSFDLDIGAGAEFSVKAQRVLSITPLVPDPADTIGIAGRPLTLAFSAVILTTIYCGPYPTPCCMRQRYTQAFDLGSAGETTALMPVMPAARDAQLLLGNEITVAGAADLTFLYVFNPEIDSSTTPETFTAPPIVAQYGILPAFQVVLGTVTVPVGESSTPMVPIPNGANAIQINNADGGTASIVQYLNV